jgi:outer membrane protein OmpA-like peptidoglycan-associated protein
MEAPLSKNVCIVHTWGNRKGTLGLISAVLGADYPTHIKPTLADKVVRVAVNWMHIACGVLCLWQLAIQARAADPIEDVITASCQIEPAEAEKAAPRPLQVRMNASDSLKHPLAYVWSGEGGVIEGVGPAVAVNPIGLGAGSYRITGVAQDAYLNRAECIVEFRVTAPQEPLLATCSRAQEEVQGGQMARFEATASGALGGPPRITWFSNGGSIKGEQKGELDTTGLTPAEYTVTARVEDPAGRATDCHTTVRVLSAPPPVPEPELLNLGQILFPRNVGFLASADAAKLETIAQRVLAAGKGTVSVEAYAAPDERDGQKLAAGRAESVKQVLVSKGVPEGSIHVRVGLGGRLGGVRNRTLDLVWVPEGFSY